MQKANYRTFQLLLILAFLVLALARTRAQSEVYLVEGSPGSFKPIEKLLLEEELDSVRGLTEDLLAVAKKSKIKGIALLYQGQAMEDDQAAIISFQEAAQWFEKAKFVSGQAMATAKEAEIYFFLQDLEQADALFSLAAKLADQAKVPQVFMDACQYQAIIATQENRPVESIQFLRKAARSMSSQKEPAVYRDFINQMATNYQAMGQLDSAIFYFEELIRFNQQQENPEALLGDYSALGNLYKEKGDYYQAQEALLQALEIAETTRDSFLRIKIYSDIGDVYAEQQLPEDAGSYYQKALDLSTALGRDFSSANIHLQLAKLFQQTQQPEPGIQNAETAFQLYQALNNRSKSAETLLLLSELYKKQSNYPEAKRLLEEALAVRDELEDQQGTLAIKKALATLETNQGNPQRAVRLAQECLSAYQAMKDAKGIRDSYQLLAAAFAENSAFAKAFQAQSQFMAINDSLVSVERTMAIYESNARYELAKQEKAIAQANERIQTQRVLLLRRSNWIIALGAGFIIFALSVVFLVYLFQKNKQLNRQQIAVLEKEKESQKLRAMIEGEEKERKRFAQELHDGLGAVLAGVKMSISKMKNEAPEQIPVPAYQKASELIDNACRSVREIAHNLMPYALEQQGLFFAMEDLCQNFRSQQNLEIDFFHFGEEDLLDDTVKITTFRICQELLSNCVKHAQASSIIVQLTIEPEELMLVIEDDGIGFDPQKTVSGIGLSNIQSRVNYMDGELHIDTRPDRGSTFTITLPIQ